MKRRQFNLGYFISQGFHSIFSHGLMSFAAVCMIVACLIIMGSFSLIAINADRMLGALEDSNEFLAYVDEYYTDSQVQDLIDRVSRVDNVASVTYVTREEAKEAYLEGHQGDELYASIPDDVFRDRLSIHVTDLKRFRETVDAVRAMEGVANYRAESEIAEGFVAVRNAAAGLAAVLVAVLAAVSLFIIANTIRLATFVRRDEIAIMKMCGATDSFIRWPFVFEGLILGLMGAVVAFFLQWGVYEAVAETLARSSVMVLFSSGIIPYETIWPSVLQVFLLGGALIGAVGSGFAIRKFLLV